MSLYQSMVADSDLRPLAVQILTATSVLLGFGAVLQAIAYLQLSWGESWTFRLTAALLLLTWPPMFSAMWPDRSTRLPFGSTSRTIGRVLIPTGLFTIMCAWSGSWEPRLVFVAGMGSVVTTIGLADHLYNRIPASRPPDGPDL